MIGLFEIRKANADYAAQDHSGPVCVFAGATAGIGPATLRDIVGLLDELKEAGPMNRIVYIEAQIFLISRVDKACALIREATKKVDMICVSPGGRPFQGAVYTGVGLESCFAVSYYSHLRLISNLLPLLNKSSKPRVVSIFSGIKKKKMIEEDLGLNQNCSITAVINYTTVCTSLAFDYLAANDSQKHITFIHDTPGFVSTNTMRTS